MSSRPKPPVTGAPGLAGDRCYKLGPWCAPGVSLQGKAIMGTSVDLLCAGSAVSQPPLGRGSPPKPSLTCFLWTQPCLLRSISFTCTHESTHREQRVCFHRRYTSHIFLLLFVCACVRVSPTGEMKKWSHIPGNSFQETSKNKAEYRESELLRNVLGDFWIIYAIGTKLV